VLQHNTIEAVLERGETLNDTVVIMMLLCVAAQHDRSCAGAGGDAERHCCNYDVALCCSTTRQKLCLCGGRSWMTLL
jgi:hypothetical protein